MILMPCSNKVTQELVCACIQESASTSTNLVFLPSLILPTMASSIDLVDFVGHKLLTPTSLGMLALSLAGLLLLVSAIISHAIHLQHLA
jgi:hypothetical protein